MSKKNWCFFVLRSPNYLAKKAAICWEKGTKIGHTFQKIDPCYNDSATEHLCYCKNVRFAVMSFSEEKSFCSLQVQSNRLKLAKDF